MKVQCASGGLRADKSQHRQIAVPLRIGELRHADVVTWNPKQKGIGEKKVRVGNAGQEIVSDSEGEVEPVEAVRGQHGEVRRPHLASVKARLVLAVAWGEARDATHA